VLANGGIDTPEKALEIIKNYPDIDGLGIARGVLGKPWLFQQIKDFLKKEKYTEPDFKTIKKLMINHAELLWQDKKSRGMFEVRKHLAWYIKGFPGASEIRQKLVLVKNLKEIKAILKNIK
jgi:tRNA-dihydrouridine synthase